MSAINQLFQNMDETDLKQKIVEELLDSEKNLETKTELNKPITWTCLNVMNDFINDKKFKKSGQILGGFMNTAFKYLISHNREGRKEYIEALKSLSRMMENEEKAKSMLNPIGA